MLIFERQRMLTSASRAPFFGVRNSAPAPPSDILFSAAVMEAKAFAEGAMRAAYKFQDLSDDQTDVDWVAKISLKGDAEQDRVYFDDVKVRILRHPYTQHFVSWGRGRVDVRCSWDV